MILRIIIVCGAVLLLATGCGSASAGGGSGLDVVAAENVYGDIAQQIGGAHVAVTSILSDPNADPHLFEPGTRSGLAVANARLVIQNGVGYDAFMTRLEHASPSSHRRVVTIADVLGVHGKDANPHLWYDVPKLPAVAAAIAAGLERPTRRTPPRTAPGCAGSTSSLAPLQREVARIRTSFAGTPVAYTEPVPGYLLDAAGLRNLAPAAFTRAIEDGTRADAAGGRRDDRARDAEDDRACCSTTARPCRRSRSASATQRRTPASRSSASPRRCRRSVSFQTWQLAQATQLDAALRR